MLGVFVVFIVFSFITIIVKMGLDHSRANRLAQGGAGAENSLRMSELKSLMREAVEEGTAVLSDRIDALEARVDAVDGPTRRLSAGKERLLEEPEMPEARSEASSEAPV